MKLLGQAADGGDPMARFQLGQIYEEGKFGMDVDYRKARALYEGSTQYPPSLLCLGMLFARGLGVHVDYQKAFKYFFNAARMGSPKAMFLTGLCLVEGKGVPRSEKGWNMIQAAASRGVEEAVEYLRKHRQ